LAAEGYPALAGVIQLGAPGRAVLVEPSLDGARADSQPAGHCCEGWTALADRLIQRLLEMLEPGWPMAWRHRGRIAAQDAGQRRVGARHRNVQVACPERERRRWRTEVNLASAEDTGERLMGARRGLGEAGTGGQYWPTRARRDECAERGDAELQS
jgi:hypothetical protein